MVNQFVASLEAELANMIMLNMSLCLKTPVAYIKLIVFT